MPLQSMNYLLESKSRKLKNNPPFWIGVLPAALSLGAGSASAEPAGKKKTPAKNPATKLYSAERSLTRQAKLARARAALVAREMAATPLPRYKVDASGDL